MHPSVILSRRARGRPVFCDQQGNWPPVGWSLSTSDHPDVGSACIQRAQLLRDGAPARWLTRQRAACPGMKHLARHASELFSQRAGDQHGFQGAGP